MAKKSMIAREKRRANLVAHNWSKRQQLKKVIKSPTSSSEERWEAMVRLQCCRRDESPTRRRSRCFQCGRPNGVLTKRFSLCRCCLRLIWSQGKMPGMFKYN